MVQIFSRVSLVTVFAVLAAVAETQQPAEVDFIVNARDTDDASGNDYTIIKHMVERYAECAGTYYSVWTLDTGQSDYTSTEAEHIANYYEYHHGLPKSYLATPASVTYNCFPYALGKGALWYQGQGLPLCILNEEWEQEEDGISGGATIAMHWEKHGSNEDLVHGSRVVVFAYWGTIVVPGFQGKYGLCGVYRTPTYFPEYYYSSANKTRYYKAASP